MNKQLPLLWINLDRATKRKACMDWATQSGGWHAHRIRAVDSEDLYQRLVPLPNPFNAGTPLPGLYRRDEAQPKRVTTRAELACLASWKKALIMARKIKSPSGWYLVMEDDLGASLATPEGWTHSLLELIGSVQIKHLQSSWHQ